MAWSHKPSRWVTDSRHGEYMETECMNMNKNECAKTPPMGWNSWDCYGASVTEDILIGNAEYMARHMKAFGWEYVVCDIQWYEPEAKSTEYNHFYPLVMDEWSRLVPAANRFPSAANGAGFKPIADRIHALGLKFGIHIMRGIPRQAVHAATPVKGTTSTARDIAQSYSICSWNTDMYGVNPDAEGAQAYYDSLFELYASWGVDFVKVDDICVTEYKPAQPYSAKREIEMIRRAIDGCGRPMVLSLSPGPAVPAEAEHLSQHANMWRMTGDFWDNWEQLHAMFDYCNTWAPHVREGCWPDCDMLPLGRIGLNTPGHDDRARASNFTKDEQVTMMTLWCMFRSPLMMGGELRQNDNRTLSLLTNPEVLHLLAHSTGARQVRRTADSVIWTSRCTDAKDGAETCAYVALFNTAYHVTRPGIPFLNLGLKGRYTARDLWQREDIGAYENRLDVDVPIHGARLIKLTRAD